MGGGKGTGPSQQVQNAEIANSTALTKIAEQSNQRAGQLFDTSFPGFQSAENFYSTLSTGDPYAISRAIAPASQQITQAADSAKANILRNAPPGGEKNLALEQVEANRGAQVGGTAAQGYLNSFNALAQLAGQGVNQSISSTGAAVGAYGTGSSTLANLGNQQVEAARLKAEEKGGMFGALGDLGGGILGAIA